jgi:hypothetical protein
MQSNQKMKYEAFIYNDEVTWYTWDTKSDNGQPS